HHPWVRGIEYVDEEVRHGSFFQSRIEGLDEFVGQLADKADRVCEQKRLFIRQGDLAGSGIESRKELVLDQDISARQAAEQGGLSRVGVSYDGGIGDGSPLTIFALCGAGAADSGEFFLEAI